ncbi:methyltransferase [Novosphingobium sp. Gsoil 351]|uniref:methyltransferase n=1 Tax=Novosphingobium sp. Gsoil 351 TaxID=2675225 RepID=UPI0012B4B5EF|nr:methyltransferase [Novosphingobium sp. Gsoil 351]QGN54578.1 methyltransferase domain-containing protein [Novosphingobium sp. Gsoil 351]
MQTSGDLGDKPPSGVRAAWLRWRNRVLASTRFQQAAAAFPLSRAIARRKAAGLFDLVAGFAYSQVLAATLDSELLDFLEAAPATTGAVAARTGLSPQAAERLLRAAAALDLTEQIAPGWWTLGQQGAALSGNLGARAMIRHHRLLYADLADPLALLRADRREPTALAKFWTYSASATGAEAGPYTQLMAASQAMVAAQVVPAYRFDRHRALLDVGGGSGTFARAVGAAHPALRIGVLDLPGVIASLPPSAIEPHAGDFLRDPLPPGYDLISLVRVLHDHDDSPAQHLLYAIHAALPPGGSLLLAEPMADTRGARAMGDAYFGTYLWAMGSGRPRTAREIGAMLKAAGFRRWREVATSQPLIARIIVALS